MKQGCQAGIKLGLSDDKQHLEVTGVSEEHNHLISKVRKAQSIQLLTVFSLVGLGT